MTTEYPFNLDITKNNIEFNEFNITRDEPPSLKLIIGPLEKDYIKKISIRNIDFEELNKIVSIKRNSQKYNSLNFSYYKFEKNITYNIIINFNKKRENLYTLEKININDFSSDNIQEFSKGSITYHNKDDKFIIFNWKKYENIYITSTNKDVKFGLSNLDESQYKSIDTVFPALNFTRLNYLNNAYIKKPSTFKYSVLFIELYEKETEIEFEIIEINNNYEYKEGVSTSQIVLIVIACILIIILILIFIHRFRKRNYSEELERQARAIEKQEMLSDFN